MRESPLLSRWRIGTSANNGLQLLTMYLYGYSLPITPGKTLQSVQLPNDPDIKILAMAMVYQSQLNLGSPFTQVGITSDEQTNLGSLDGGGYSYSMNALGGSSVAWGHDVHSGIRWPE